MLFQSLYDFFCGYFEKCQTLKVTGVQNNYDFHGFDKTVFPNCHTDLETRDDVFYALLLLPYIFYI